LVPDAALVRLSFLSLLVPFCILVTWLRTVTCV
jgi:hypothetical protein